MAMFIWLLIGALTILGGVMGVKNKKFATSPEDAMPLSKKDVNVLMTKRFRFFERYYREGKPAIILGYFFILVGIAIIAFSLKYYL